VSTARIVLVLGGMPLACAALLLMGHALPDVIGRPLYEVGGIGLFLSLTALLTVGAVIAGTELFVLVRKWFGAVGRIGEQP